MRFFISTIFCLLAGLLLGCSQKKSSHSKPDLRLAASDTIVQIPGPDSCIMEVLIPESGQNRLQFVNQQLVVLNVRSGWIRAISNRGIDTIHPRLAADVFLTESNLFMGLGTTWLITDSCLWDWPAQVMYRYDKPVRPMLSSSTLQQTSPSGELLLHTGYHVDKRLDASGRKWYGQRFGLIALKINKKAQKAVIQELPLPIIPPEWNDGKYYGMGSFYHLYDSVLVYSYQKYGRVYLYHLYERKVVDSVDFPDLREWGLEPAPERYTTNQRIKQLQKEPRYNPCYLANDYLVRLVKKKEQTWLMAIHLPSRRLHILEIRNAEGHSTFGLGTFNNQLFQYGYEEMADFTKLRLCKFDLPEFLQKAGNP